MKNINPDIFAFYKDLDKNNNREWFENQKVRFKALESEVKDFNELVKYGLEETDDIEKVKMFRIYRDVRFSKNKTPYKTHFGVSFHRKKPNLRGNYYMHLAPQNSFIASCKKVICILIFRVIFILFKKQFSKFKSILWFILIRHWITVMGLFKLDSKR